MGRSSENRRSLPLVLGALACAGVLAGREPRAADDDLERRFAAGIRPILARACVSCHGGAKREGGLNLASAGDGTPALAHRGVWRRVRARVEAGEMPPDDAGIDLSDSDRKMVMDWVGRALAEGADRSRRDPWPAVLRRLTRTEYVLTLRDLFGLPEEVLDRLDLPEDPPGDHFENLGAALSLAPSALERYFAAADRVAEIVFGREWSAGGVRNRLMTVKPLPDSPEREAARQSLARIVRRRRSPAIPGYPRVGGDGLAIVGNPQAARRRRARRRLMNQSATTDVPPRTIVFGSGAAKPEKTIPGIGSMPGNRLMSGAIMSMLAGSA